MQDPEKTMVSWSLKEAMEMAHIRLKMQLSPRHVATAAIGAPIQDTIENRIASLIAIELSSIV